MGNKSGKASAAAAARKHQQHAGHVVLPRATAACDALLPPFLVDFNVGKRVLLWLTPRDVLSFSLVNRACSALCLQDIVWAKLYRREKWGAKEPVAPGSVCCYKRAFMLRYTNCTERMARLRGTLHSVNKQLGDLTDLYRAKRDDLHRERLRTIGQIETKAKTCAWCVAFFCFFVEILCSLHGYDPLWAFFAALLVVVRHPIDALEELFPANTIALAVFSAPVRLFYVLTVYCCRVLWCAVLIVLLVLLVHPTLDFLHALVATAAYVCGPNMIGRRVHDADPSHKIQAACIDYDALEKALEEAYYQEKVPLLRHQWLVERMITTLDVRSRSKLV
eukprot:TRINITY_DN4896_c0_g1_i1.p1 TRINITY_DN4896_c0_g1~~TRINITY_DN4896_c0_g1_i1.p1  ORF type:complete len:334 (+),score=67.13 TRINITY_DN4896_c0_g1_i1:32-1033(+)